MTTATGYGVEPICRQLPIAPSTYYGFCDYPAHFIKYRCRPRGDWAVAVRSN